MKLSFNIRTGPFTSTNSHTCFSAGEPGSPNSFDTLGSRHRTRGLRQSKHFSQPSSKHVVRVDCDTRRPPPSNTRGTYVVLNANSELTSFEFRTSRVFLGLFGLISGDIPSYLSHQARSLRRGFSDMVFGVLFVRWRFLFNYQGKE